MIPSVSQYAGQQMLTGQQAEAYADHFIAVHIQDMGAGKTYSQLSAESIAQPNNAKLAAPVGTVFKGETLRSMLLNAYGWWKVSQIVYIVSLALFGLGALAGLAPPSPPPQRRPGGPARRPRDHPPGHDRVSSPRPKTPTRTTTSRHGKTPGQRPP